MAGTPTAALLDPAGWGLLHDPEAWDKRRARRQAEVRDRMNAERQAEIAKYDTWLGERLAVGQVLLTVIEQGCRGGVAAAAGQERALPVARRGRDAPRVARAEEERGGPVYWALPDAWDRDRFRPLTTTRSMAGLR